MDYYLFIHLDFLYQENIKAILLGDFKQDIPIYLYIDKIGDNN